MNTNNSILIPKTISKHEMDKVIDSFNNNKYPSRYEIPLPIIKFSEPLLIKILKDLVNPSLINWNINFQTSLKFLK